MGAHVWSGTLPARPPAAARPADRAGRRTGTPGAPPSTSTWWCRSWRSWSWTSCCRTGSPSSWSRSAAWSPCRSPPGPSASSAGLRFPGPPMLAVATVFFLFDSRFTIYGGNIASTMAGEFAFAISLVAGARLPRGASPAACAPAATGRSAAVLLALVGLCHLIPAFFAVVGTAGRCWPCYARRSSLRWLRHDGARRRPARRLLGPAVRLAPRLHERHGLGEDPALEGVSRCWSTGLVGPRRRLAVAVGHADRLAAGPHRPSPAASPAASGRTCSWRVDDRDRRRGVRRCCPRAGSGTPASCPSTTCASTCWPPSAVVEVVRALAARFVDERARRPPRRPRRGARRRPARRPGLRWA